MLLIQFQAPEFQEATTCWVLVEEECPKLSDKVMKTPLSQLYICVWPDFLHILQTTEHNRLT